MQTYLPIQLADKKYLDTCKQHYSVFWKMGINTGVIDSHHDFSKYKLIVAPMLYMMSDEIIDKIEQYVKGGGNIVLTYASGMVNENDLCHLGGFPAGKLKDVFGLWAEEIDTLYPGEKNTIKYDGNKFIAKDYCEIINTSTADVVAVYDTDFYKGKPACCHNSYGDGHTYYVGFRDDGSFIQKLYGEIIGELEIKTELDTVLPDGVTVHSRSNDNNKYIFIENYSGENKKLLIKDEYIDIETNKTINDNISVEGYGVRVLCKNGYKRR